jgi:hypothetical protein
MASTLPEGTHEGTLHRGGGAHKQQLGGFVAARAAVFNVVDEPAEEHALLAWWTACSTAGTGLPDGPRGASTAPRVSARCHQHASYPRHRSSVLKFTDVDALAAAAAARVASFSF